MTIEPVRFFVIGFTGTRNGMTEEQRVKMQACLAMVYHHRPSEPKDVPIVGLHGDCVGADADFNALCRETGFATFCRPCTHHDPTLRA